LFDNTIFSICESLKPISENLPTEEVIQKHLKRVSSLNKLFRKNPEDKDAYFRLIEAIHHFESYLSNIEDKSTPFVKNSIEDLQALKSTVTPKEYFS